MTEPTDSNLSPETFTNPELPSAAPDMVDGQRQFPCRQCGAKLVFQPGSTHLFCKYCGHDNPIQVSGTPVEELCFDTHLQELQNSADTVVRLTIKCQSCAAESTMPEGRTSGACPFCGTPIVAQAAATRLIKPRSLLPFAIASNQANEAFRKWLHSLWFAPSSLKKFAERDSMLKGIYMPAWTYDSQTTSQYTGERGEDYWTTETYTSWENGKSVTRTRQVKRTRWYPAAGTVHHFFDDVLVMASHSLPVQLQNKLAPWDLPQLTPYSDEFLSGFVTESYQDDLPTGFEAAKSIMDVTIRQLICRDIGGDHQRIHTVNTSYSKVTFKHILLPVWLSAYRFHNRVFRFMVNARTGAVAGERPYSAWKIALTVIAAVLVIGGAILIFSNK